jgi:hypothetical protein
LIKDSFFVEIMLGPIFFYANFENFASQNKK